MNRARIVLLLMMLYAATWTAKADDVAWSGVFPQETGTGIASSDQDVNARDSRGQTPLMATALWTQYDLVGGEEGYAKEAEQLLWRGADINARNNGGMTALMYAAGWGHPLVLQTLLKHGANVNLRDRMGRTALTWAARHGANSDLVRALRQHGATVGLLEAILALLSAGAHVNARNSAGQTPLLQAVWGSTPETVNSLLKAGADVNRADRDDNTPLKMAGNYGFRDIVALLKQAGATE